MLVSISTTEELGRLVRASRKAQSLRLDDSAGSVGVSENFLSKLERGGETVQLGKVLKVLRDLGITIHLDVTEEAAARYTALKASLPVREGRP